MTKSNGLAAIALAELFRIALDKAKPIVEQEIIDRIDEMLSERIDNVVKNDARDGWSNTHVGDPKNDYPGDAISKRIDNMIFLFGKALPGEVTDRIRDAVSPILTPRIRAMVDDQVNPQTMAELVADELSAEAEALIKSIVEVD